MNLNKALVVGRMTRDPELRALPNGTPVCSLSLATNLTYKTREGEKKENTEFHNIVVFGSQADSSSKFLKKGQMVMVEGRIQTRSWEKEGAKHYKTEIIAERVQFGPRLNGMTVEPDDSHKPPGVAPEGVKVQPKAKAQKAEAPGYEYPTDDINPEDIPF